MILTQFSEIKSDRKSCFLLSKYLELIIDRRFFFKDPPDLFSDDGTLTPDPMREDGTDESPLHMNNRNMQNMKGGIPTEKLKKIRINRKDFKKGGDGLRGKNVTEQFRVKDKDMKRTMK